MAITRNDIRCIFSNKIQQGTCIHVSDIHSLVETNYPLDKSDWEPHTTTRATNYPVWKHKVQGVLSSMKEAGIVEHDAEKNEYTF